jgi:hypothetical protein
MKRIYTLVALMLLCSCFRFEIECGGESCGLGGDKGEEGGSQFPQPLAAPVDDDSSPAELIENFARNLP